MTTPDSDIVLHEGDYRVRVIRGWDNHYQATAVEYHFNGQWREFRCFKSAETAVIFYRALLIYGDQWTLPNDVFDWSEWGKYFGAQKEVHP